MCFNATASITAGVVIGATGIICFQKSNTSQQRFLSLMPIMFSVQQFIEGMIWLSFKETDFLEWRYSLTILFLIFARVIWPIYVPVAILYLEKDFRRKKLLYGIILAGLALSLHAVYLLIYSNPTASVFNSHIHYDIIARASYKSPVTILYILTTVGPFFISGIRKMWIIGSANVLAIILTALLYPRTIPSTWCFFAAFISMVVLSIILDLRKEDDQKDFRKFSKVF